MQLLRTRRKGSAQAAAVLSVLGLLLGLMVPRSPAQAKPKTVMVVDFADRTGNWSDTETAVTTRVISRLRGDASLRVLPRDRVQEALRAAKAETSGFIDRDDALKVAKNLEADYVVMGEVTAFDQQHHSVCLPIGACAESITASVTLSGKVLNVATGQFVGEPKAEARKQQGGVTVYTDLGDVNLEHFDDQVIGKATLEAVDKFVRDAKSRLK